MKEPSRGVGIHLHLLKKAYERNESLTYEDAKRYIDVLDEEIARLNAIVVDFLFAVRPIDVRTRLGRITTLLDQVCDFVEPELNEAGITLKRTYPAALPRLMIDNNASSRVLLNIIKNAMNAIKIRNDQSGQDRLEQRLISSDTESESRRSAGKILSHTIRPIKRNRPGHDRRL